MGHQPTVTLTPVDHPARACVAWGSTSTPPSSSADPASSGRARRLRRFPTLWIACIRAEVDVGELARSLGLGAGVGERSRLASTLGRRVTVGQPRTAHDRAGLDVYRQVPGLLGARLTQVETASRHRANVVSVAARLDRLEHRVESRLDGPTRHGPGIA